MPVSVTSPALLMNMPLESSATAGLALREVVWRARDAGRLVTGVHACAALLECAPMSAMVCVVSGGGDENEEQTGVSADIHRLLIEAFCREEDIRLVKVDSLHKMAEVVCGRGHGNHGNNGNLQPGRPTPDVSCLIVQYPTSEGASEAEEVLSACHKAALYHGQDAVAAALPD